jgi:hypothetical protein
VTLLIAGIHCVGRPTDHVPLSAPAWTMSLGPSLKPFWYVRFVFWAEYNDLCVLICIGLSLSLSLRVSVY